MREFHPLFGPLSEPVIAIRDGDIQYYNKAAEKLFPDIAESAPEGILPEQIIYHDAEAFVGEVHVNGTQYSASVSHLLGHRIITLTGYDEHGDSAYSRSAFTAISGELANRLAILKMASGLGLPYLENSGEKKLQTYAAMIYHSYYAIKHLCENLESLGESLNGGGVLICSHFDLSDLCREVLDTVRFLAPEQGVSFTLRGCDEARLIFADAPKIARLLLNLLSNSLKHVGTQGEITLSVTDLPKHTVIAVSDTGEGVPSETQWTVWSRYSEDRVLSSVTDGAGLGMTVVQHIARLHGGSAVIESRAGERTTVTVSLPKRASESLELHDARSFYAENLLQMALTEFSGIIGTEKYTQRLMD